MAEEIRAFLFLNQFIEKVIHAIGLNDWYKEQCSKNLSTWLGLVTLLIVGNLRDRGMHVQYIQLMNINIM
jgi:hypothetical protein